MELPCRDRSSDLQGDELDDLMQFFHRDSSAELSPKYISFLNYIQNTSPWKLQKRINQFLHKLYLIWQCIYVNNLKKKKCFVSSFRKTQQAGRQLSNQGGRPLEVKNKALLKIPESYGPISVLYTIYELCWCRVPCFVFLIKTVPHLHG